METQPELDPPLFPDELVATAGERTVLETFLDLYRDAIVHKVRGLSDDDAGRRLVGWCRPPAPGRPASGGRPRR